MLQLFSRHEFERAVIEHRAERHARGFTCWGQFVAMLFCHLGRAQSLREICGGLRASEGKLRHLGLPDAPKRSTLAYANEHRPWQLYRSVFYQLLSRCREIAGTHGFRFKNKLLSLDATLIELCATVFDWAQYRRTKGAVKLHLLLDHQGLLPSYAVITAGRVHESRIAPTLRFQPRNHRGLRPRLQQLCLVCRARPRQRLLRHSHEGQHRLWRRGTPPPARARPRPARRDHLSLQTGPRRQTRSVPASHRGLGRGSAPWSS